MRISRSISLVFAGCCLWLTGGKLFATEIAMPEISGAGVDGNTILFSQTTGTRLVAMDMNTNQVKWVFDAGKRAVQEAPLVESGIAYVWVGPLDSSACAIDCRTGRRIWESKTSGSALGAPVSCGPLVLCPAVEMNYKIYVFAKATGQQAWFRNVHKLLLVHGDRILCAGPRDETLVVLEAATGKELASFPTGPGRHTEMQAACSEDGIAVASCKGVLLAVDIGALKEVWRKDTGDQKWVPAINAGEIVLLRGYTGEELPKTGGMPIEVRDLRSGELTRRGKIPDADVRTFTYTPAMFFGKDRIVIDTNWILGLDRSSLKVEWRHPLKAYGFLPYKDTLFIGGARPAGPALHQLDVKTGQVLWQYQGTNIKPLPDAPRTQPAK